VYPGGPDEIGWIWDSKRDLLWHLPGFSFLGQPSPSQPCREVMNWTTTSPINITTPHIYFVSTGAPVQVFQENVHYRVQYNSPSVGQATVTNIGGLPGSVLVVYQPQTMARMQPTILTFDPSKKKWIDPQVAPEPGNQQKPKNAIYDPVTDSIYRSGFFGGSMTWSVFHISKNTWDLYETPCAINNPGFPWNQSGPCGEGHTYINNTELGFEYIAADITGRKIYSIDPFNYQLLEFDMDKHTVMIKAKIPEPDPVRIANSRNLVHTLKDVTQVVFDPTNRVLLYPFMRDFGRQNMALLIYHPDTDQWEVDPMYQPDGIQVWADHTAFSAKHNILMFYGGYAESQDPPQTHFFLYRYGNGK
jgi:hypothetical protein